jgi:hypothetical protein
VTGVSVLGRVVLILGWCRAWCRRAQAAARSRHDPNFDPVRPGFRAPVAVLPHRCRTARPALLIASDEMTVEVEPLGAVGLASSTPYPCAGPSGQPEGRHKGPLRQLRLPATANDAPTMSSWTHLTTGHPKPGARVPVPHGVPASNGPRRGPTTVSASSRGPLHLDRMPATWPRAENLRYSSMLSGL